MPPNFSSDVLGHQDPGLDRGVTIRHTEGIYSKRLKMENYTMRESRGTGWIYTHTHSKIKLKITVNHLINS